jgi:hypothetical protein
MIKKYLWMMLMISMPMMSNAQNTWENNTVKNEVDANPNQKYLEGAVPLVNGKVVFTKTFEAPGKTSLPDL